MMPTYEYKSVTLKREPGKPYDDPDISAILNDEGAEGWQLVSVAVIPPAMLSIFYLMRQ